MVMAQWNTDFNPNADYTIGGDWTFNGDVTMANVIIDSLTIDYIDATNIFADTLWLDSDNYITGTPNVEMRFHAMNANMWMYLKNLGLHSSATSGWLLRNQNAGATTPTLIPNKNDTDTGIGSAAADELSLIAGEREGIRLDEESSLITAYVQDGHLVLVEQASLPGSPSEGSMAVKDDTLFIYKNSAWYYAALTAR